jgi:pimeloyl-ACP methyl ester carboxylesterase
MKTETKTIVLIHGLWMTPRSWEYFRNFYEEKGFQVFAPAWPRLRGEVEEIRRDPSALAGLGLLEVFEHYEKFVLSLDEAPILIGHSFGGLAVQVLLDRGLGAAGVSIDGTPPKGILPLPFSVIKAANPVLSNPFNYWRTVALTFEQFRYTFAHTMPEPDARAAYARNAIPAPGRTVFQSAFGNLTPHAATTVNHLNNHRAPLLLIAGGSDHLVPPILNRINHQKYAKSRAVTEYKEFPGRSHLIVAQDGWEEVAAFALDWAQAAIRQAAPELAQSGSLGANS